MVGAVGIRAIVAIVGIVGLLLFLGAGLGSGPLASVVGPPPCPTCSNVPHITVGPPQVTSTGLNASITVFGTVSPIRFVALVNEVINVQGVSTNVPLTNATSSPTTGAFVLSPFSYHAATQGSYTVFTTVTGRLSGSTVAVSSTSPPVSFTVHNTAVTGNTSTLCGSSGCPTVVPSFKVAGFGLTVYANDTSTDTNATSTQVVMSFGDGSGPVTTTLDQSTSHAYSTAGVYTITDTVTATSSSGTKATGSVSVTVSVAPGTFHNTTTLGNGTGTTIAPTGFNGFTDSGIGISIGLVVMGAMGRWKEGLILLLGLGVGGYLFGTFL